MGPEQVGGDGGLGVGGGVVRRGKDFGPHDARIVDDGVEGREIGDKLRGEGFDALGVLDVEDGGGHAGVGGDGLIEHGLAPAGDDDFVAESVERLGEGAADARTAAGDEDGISSGFHGVHSPELIVG